MLSPQKDGYHLLFGGGGSQNLRSLWGQTGTQFLAKGQPTNAIANTFPKVEIFYETGLRLVTGEGAVQHHIS